MVAYSFKRRFVEPIEQGAKCQTIRADRKRHARTGEELQLYYAMRTKQCRLIRVARCVGAHPIIIDFEKTRIEYFHSAGSTYYNARTIDDFARLDGFDDWSDMREFWQAEHGALNEFRGVLIRWAP